MLLRFFLRQQNKLHSQIEATLNQWTKLIEAAASDRANTVFHLKKTMNDIMKCVWGNQIFRCWTNGNYLYTCTDT